MQTDKRNMLLLTLCFGVMMSLPWLVPHMGFVALFGFLPLLFMDRIATRTGMRRFWIWHYSAFVLWNAFTTFWVCNATVGGAIFAVLANAFQMSLVFGLYRLGRKHFSGNVPFIFLVAAWIAWERFYLVSAEISWPWLVLGNAFARSTHIIQWYEVTGTLGGSLWVWLTNIGIFSLVTALIDGKWEKARPIQKIAGVTSLAAVLVVPVAASLIIYAHADEGVEGSLDVMIAQPNIDPYHKFQAMDQSEQTAILLAQLEEGYREAGQPETPLLMLAPETFTNDIIVGNHASSYTWRRMLSFLQDKANSTILFGASSYEFTEGGPAPSDLARKLSDGRWMRVHNSALTLDREGDSEIFHKSKLVVGVEKTPYPKVFTKLDNLIGKMLQMNGGVMGRDEGQEEVSLLHCGDVPLGCAICYESIYGEYCAGFVRKGAKALAVITNDAWWGDTPGYRQHLSYSRLRAIELRRDIARCANTGISAFIDSKGDIVSSTDWWERQRLDGKVALRSDETFFVVHGDIVGRVCSFMFILLILSLAAQMTMKGKMRKK